MLHSLCPTMGFFLCFVFYMTSDAKVRQDKNLQYIISLKLIKMDISIDEFSGKLVTLL